MVDNRKTSLEIYCVKDNFLRFFGYSLLSGNPEQALVDAHSIVLTESAARKLFGDEPAEGTTASFLLVVFAGRHAAGRSFGMVRRTADRRYPALFTHGDVGRVWRGLSAGSLDFFRFRVSHQLGSRS